MQPYKFINSRLIAKALEENGYEFSPFECACLIQQSMKTTLAEKQEAWSELISTTPDEIIRIANRKIGFHDYLQNLINLQNELLKEFHNRTRDETYEHEAATLVPSVFGTTFVPGGKYKIKYIYRGEAEYEPDTYFTDYDACVAYINNDAEKEHYKSGTLVRYEIQNVYKGTTIILITNRNFEVVQIKYWGENAKSQQLQYLSNFVVRVEEDGNVAL